MVVTLGQQYNIGERPTVILYTYINRHPGTPEKQRRQNSTSSNMIVIIYCCYIGYEDEVTTLKREHRGPGCRYLYHPKSTRHRYSPGSMYLVWMYCLERLGSQLAYASGDLSRFDILMSSLLLAVSEVLCLTTIYIISSTVLVVLSSTG